jgi:2-hydroxycyclohexanecarboxyl-CoA dehydrogenase
VRGKPRVAIEGAVAVVTGAGRGIGRATALALGGRGATVVCADIDRGAAEKVAAQCREVGATAEPFFVDVADRTAVVVLADQVERDIGPVAVLVNNAGVGMSGPFTDMSAEDWDWVRSINLDGVVSGCAAFGPPMLRRGRGHVVNLSSGLGYTPSARESGYASTKAAVLALSQCLRADWARGGVGVSAVCPGLINTPIVEHARYLGEDGQARRARAMRIFRRGHSPEVAAAAIIGAIDRDRAVVTVGAEARIGWYLHRLAPVALQQAVARAGTRRRVPSGAASGRAR